MVLEESDWHFSSGRPLWTSRRGMDGCLEASLVCEGELDPTNRCHASWPEPRQTRAEKTK